MNMHKNRSKGSGNDIEIQWNQKRIDKNKIGSTPEIAPSLCQSSSFDSYTRMSLRSCCHKTLYEQFSDQIQNIERGTHGNPKNMLFCNLLNL
ncbi:hypothetical protein Hdeb2414_s0006g00195011 [Helianthus debilis subsp. tardiflorus]